MTERKGVNFTYWAACGCVITVTNGTEQAHTCQPSTEAVTDHG